MSNEVSRPASFLASSSGNCSESLLGLDHGLNTVVHVLDEIDLGATQSAEVRNVEDAVIGFSVLTMNSPDLNVVFIGNFLELLFFLSQFWPALQKWRSFPL